MSNCILWLTLLIQGFFFLNLSNVCVSWKSTISSRLSRTIRLQSSNFPYNNAATESIDYGFTSRKEKFEKLQEFYKNNKNNEFTAILKAFAAEEAAKFKNNRNTHQQNHMNLIYSEFAKNKIFIDSLNPIQISDWLWSLPRLGCNLDDPNYLKLCNDLVNNLSKRSIEISSRQVTTAMGGLQKMKFNYNIQTDEMKENILYLLDSVADKLNDREVGNLLYAISKIELNWDTLPLNIQTKLFKSFSKVANILKYQRASMSIYAFGLLGVNILNLSNEIKSSIYTVSETILTEGSKTNDRQPITQQVSNVIWGLSKIGCLKSNLPENLEIAVINAVTASIPHMNSQEVPNIMYS